MRVDPPTFIFFMNRKHNLPESYQKYIGSALRENLGLKKQVIRVFLEVATDNFNTDNSIPSHGMELFI